VLQNPTLAHTDASALTAKAKWDADAKYRNRPNARLHLEFNEWLEYFSTNCVRFRGLARQTGVSYQRVQQIYDKYFRELFDERDGRQRYRACTLERRAIEVKQAESRLLKSDQLAGC